MRAIQGQCHCGNLRYGVDWPGDGTRTADFLVCAQCGILTLVCCDIEGARYAVVNVNTFENVEVDELERSRTSFEGEDLDSRLARRLRTWMPLSLR